VLETCAAQRHCDREVGVLGKKSRGVAGIALRLSTRSSAEMLMPWIQG